MTDSGSAIVQEDVQQDVLSVRMLPSADPLVRFFWASGADGRLRILRCPSCGYFTHPPGSRCARCLAGGLEPTPVSGLAMVHTYTVNHQQWVAGQQPYVIAIVVLDEQEDLRLTTNIVGCAPADVHIGMRVRVAFLHRDDVWYPLFTPVVEGAR